GAVLLPQAAVIMVAAPLSSVWVQRFGNKVVVATGMTLVGITFASFLTLQPNTSTLHVILVTVLLGLGMGNVMAPATDSIMRSLPRAKAGVGSAVNDTTRQVGGAFGVAVLGSILSSRFTSHFTGAVAGQVPGDVVAHAKDSVGSALGIARDLPPGAQRFAPQIVNAAKDGFINGFHAASVVAAVVVFAAALGVLRWLPARATDEEPQPDWAVAAGGLTERREGSSERQPRATYSAPAWATGPRSSICTSSTAVSGAAK